ncbi:hypothetical protein L917_13526, partial [Phytophthora nicotianae]
MGQLAIVELTPNEQSTPNLGADTEDPLSIHRLFLSRHLYPAANFLWVITVVVWCSRTHKYRQMWILTQTTTIRLVYSLDLPVELDKPEGVGSHPTVHRLQRLGDSSEPVSQVSTVDLDFLSAVTK